MRRIFVALAALILTTVPVLAARVDVVVDISSQLMEVRVGGKLKYQWAVSTGTGGYPTPRGTFRPVALKPMFYAANLGNAPMPHSIFFKWPGYAIHGTAATGRLGAPASHGCVRLAPGNAATLYSLVSRSGKQHTRITIKQ